MNGAMRYAHCAPRVARWCAQTAIPATFGAMAANRPFHIALVAQLR